MKDVLVSAYQSVSSKPSKLASLGNPLKKSTISFFATLALLTGMALSTNVVSAADNALVNPGFELGTFSGWTTFGNAALQTAANQYYNGGNSGGSPVSVHGGTYVMITYGQYLGYAANTNGVFQDVSAGAGSVWSAQGWGLTASQDLISGGNLAWIEVTFRDADGDVLSQYVSANINPASTPDTWINLAVTNQVDISDGNITNTVSTLTAPAGTAVVRYRVAYAQPADYDAGSAYFDDLSLEKIAGSDPDITTGPTNQTKIVGQSVTFSVAASGNSTLSYQWNKGANGLSNGGNISGASSAALTLSNLTLADAGTYSVLVTDGAGSISSSTAKLTMISTAEASDVLVNPGFESGAESPWVRYGGGGLHTTNDFYYLSSTPVSVYDGLYVSQTYAANADNGLYQDVATAPGTVYTGEGWALTALEDQISGSNTAWIEVTFRDANANLISHYRSAIIDATSPASTWLHLPITNQLDIADDVTVTNTTSYLTAPAGTAVARFNMYLKGAGGGGSVWFDDMSLKLKTPVALSTVVTGGNVQISFATQIGVEYQVLYKNNLTDANWTQLTTTTGDGTVWTFSDPVGQAQRYYRVVTQ